jgi:hypothetical protein
VALLVSEIQAIKAELGISQLNIGAEPYVGITSYMEQIVLPNLSTGALTSSSTAVTATVPAVATPVALTLASPTGVSVMDRLIIDVDDAQEEATVQSLAGTVATVRLAKAHSGTYPVSVEGGESLVRRYLNRCRRVAVLIDRFGSRAGLRKVDEVEFFGGSAGDNRSGFRTLSDMQGHFRRELCSLLFGVDGVSSFNGGSGGARVGLY